MNLSDLHVPGCTENMVVASWADCAPRVSGVGQFGAERRWIWHCLSRSKQGHRYMEEAVNQLPQKPESWYPDRRLEKVRPTRHMLFY